MGNTIKIASAVLLLLSVEAAVAGVLEGRVADAKGSAVSGAYIFAFDNQNRTTIPNAPHGSGTTTKRDGSFLLSLQPGFYDVCVFSAGFTASCKKILISSVNKSNYEVKLAVDPLVTKERGDSSFTP